MNNYLRIVYLVLSVLLVIVILIVYPRSEWIQKTDINFTYFSPVDNKNFNSINVQIPILNNLLSSQQAVKDMKTYIVIDDSLKNSYKKAEIKINDYKIQREVWKNIDCKSYSGACLIPFPKNILRSDNRLNIDKLSETKNCFIGINIRL